jgi:hypothetical protein
VSWCVLVRTGIVRCAHPIYEHTMKSGRGCQTWLCLSRSSDPPNGSAPQKPPQDHRVLCAVLHFDDGSASDVTSFFATRVPCDDLSVQDLATVMVATRHAVTGRVQSLVFVYGDLAERVFSINDVVLW